MAGMFEKIKKKFRDFLFVEVEVDEDGNEKVIENKVDKNVSSRLDAVVDNHVEIQEDLTNEIDDVIAATENQPKTNEKLPEKTISLKPSEVKAEIKETKKPSMFVDFNSTKSNAAEAKVEKKEEKAKSAYIPQKVISPIFGSDKDSYAISINNLEYDSEKPKKSVIGTVFSPIFGRDRIIENTVDEVDEKIASMTTSDFISEIAPAEKKEETVLPEEEAVEPPKPLYTKLKNEEKSVESATLFDAERVNKALNEAKVAFDEIEKAAKPVENTASFENISLFD